MPVHRYWSCLPFVVLVVLSAARAAEKLPFQEGRFEKGTLKYVGQLPNRRRHTMRRFLIACLLGWCCLAASRATADVEPASLFSDGMVLQCDAKAPVWGTADAGEKVTVTLGTHRTEATAGQHGKWMAKLGPMEAGGPFEMTIAGKNTVTIKNVMVGEVWVCSGQSNMEFTLLAAANGKEEVAKADYPAIRTFRVAMTMAEQPRSECQGVWALCKPPGVGWFSAVGYFFAKQIHLDRKVPVGIINCAVGGTTAQVWTSRKTLEADPELKTILADWEAWVADYPRRKQQHARDMVKWKEEAEKAKAEGKAAPSQPWLPDPKGYSWQPSALYNGMVAPLAPYAIRGVIWYQGESDAATAHRYRTHFPALIGDWRATWRQRELPFLFVQLPNFGEIRPEPGPSGWAELQEAQLLTALTVPNTGMAVTIDIGEAKDIHPKNKQDVGNRLALAARGLVYGEKIVYSGPIYDSMTVEGRAIRLKFRHVGGGLVARGGIPLRQFAIAGTDKKFVWADARIDGDTVVVSSDKVPQPVAVRYAWADNPEGCNLYNKEGLPASPFRTDGGRAGFGLPARQVTFRGLTNSDTCVRSSKG